MRQLIALVALVATAACSSDLSTEPLVENVAGTYSLSAMNVRSLTPSPLPFTITSHDTTFTIAADVIILDANGTWSESVTAHQTVGTAAQTDESFTLDGTWTRNGNNLSFYTAGPTGGLIYLGAATDLSLMLSDNSFDYVFLR